MKKICGNFLFLLHSPHLLQSLKSITEEEFVSEAESLGQALRILDQQSFEVFFVQSSIAQKNQRLFIQEVRKRNTTVPIILVGDDPNTDVSSLCLDLKAYDYITDPEDKNRVIVSVQRAVEHSRLIQKQTQIETNFEREKYRQERQLKMALMRLEDISLEYKKSHLQTVIILSKIAEFNHAEVAYHTKRISYYSEALSKIMKLPPRFVEQIFYSSAMHDIGKLCIDYRILKKPGKLTEQEFEVMKQHTIFGAQLLEGISFLKMARDIALCHHENYDGSGYPRGIQGQEIPLSARIVAVCDVFDALVSKRCYKEEYPLATAMQIMHKESQHRFDPEILDIFSQNQEMFYSIYLENRENEPEPVSLHLL